MKATIILYVIYLNYALCEGNRIIYDSSFKKGRPYSTGKILIKSAKYNFKPIDLQENSPQQKAYTVFQVIGSSKTFNGIPDSPYFAAEENFGLKSRVKKVLPNLLWSSIRYKRSAVDASADEKDDKKTELIATENKPGSKIEKIVETTLLPNMTTTLKHNKEEEMPTPARKAATLVKEDIKSTKSSTDIESKKETDTPDKMTELTSNTKTSTKTKIKGDTKTTKKSDPSRERKPESKSATKEQSKSSKLGNVRSNKKSPSKSNQTRELKSQVKGSQSESRTDTAKGKSKGTNIDRANRKTKSKDKAKLSSATNVKANSKGNDTPNIRAKEDIKVKNKKDNTKTKGNTRKKDKKRKGKTNKPLQRNKNRNRPKKGQKTKPSNGTRTGKKPKDARRLIGAREAIIEDYPYVVSIQKDEQHWCSGALLNPRLVITTANCLWKAHRLSRMEVRVGSRYVDRGGQMAGIQEVMKHPSWGIRKSPDNDVALILLDKNIKFSDAIHSVDLPNRVMMPPFDDAWVTSWGSERRDGVYDVDDAETLQVYHTRLINRDKCNNITMRFSVIVTENFICLSQSGRSAPCTRDTGAPAVSDGVLWGLASWGIRKLCGTERFPAVFSYLASHSNLDFITNATHFLMADKRGYPYANKYPDIQQSSIE